MREYEWATLSEVIFYFCLNRSVHFVVTVHPCLKSQRLPSFQQVTATETVFWLQDAWMFRFTLVPKPSRPSRV